MRSQQAELELPTPVQNFVGGSWTRPGEVQTQPVDNPATGEVLAEVPLSTDAQVDAAVGAAREAFEDWRRTPVVERVQPLFTYRDLLREHTDDLATILSLEHGKTVAEARGEIQRGIENVEVACGMPSMLRGQSGSVRDVTESMDEEAVRHPLGVFAAITPFNFPAMIPLWFLPYAVATGNTFVLKPSERVPLSAQVLVALAAEAGFPDGVVNLVNGANDAVDGLLAHDDVEGVSFVGSSPVAKYVYETGAANGKRVQAQGGAKNYAVVTEHAALDRAVPNLVGSVYGNAGQRCLANDVVVGVGDVYEELRERLADATADLTVGPGQDPDTDVGPVISAASRERILEMIATAVDEGATLLVDGRDYEDPDAPAGHFLGPTILEGVTPEMDIARTEIFGPVLCLARAESLDDAIAMVEGTDFGNASTIYTERGDEARRYQYEVTAGNVGVNVGVCAPMAFFHFGGRKDSFFGDLHAQGEDAVSFYTDKTIVLERWYS